MPARSTAQQRLMGQAYAIKIGAMEPDDLNPKYRSEIVNLSKRMTKEELKKYAETRLKGLPHYVDEAESAIPVENGVSLEPIPSDVMPKFNPHGPGKIVPFLDPDSKQKKKGKGNLQNLKDYRDWIKERK